MLSIVLFADDYVHEEFVKSLVERLSRESDVPVKITPRNARGGHGKVVTEFQIFLRDLEHAREGLPDLLIVATDANSKRYAKRRREIDKINDKFKNFTVYAIPDPHIERWLLLDSAAFKTILGKGCDKPDQKCSRDRFKQLLLNAMRNAGVIPPLGGVEYTEDIVNAMDLQRMERANASFGKFLKDLQSKFKEWSSK
ncbi:MAG: DUF4276 family protein [Thermodesulfobacteriota bacterium]|nr:DUF4276 family protein [Thermodesulfobacteriota bacterium]